jgi:hypothetical protein
LAAWDIVFTLASRVSPPLLEPLELVSLGDGPASPLDPQAHTLSANAPADAHCDLEATILRLLLRVEI